MRIGGEVAYQILRRLGSLGSTNVSSDNDSSRLGILLGDTIWEELRNKTIIDFGCGTGPDAIEVAKHGAKHVIGVDVRESVLEMARRSAQQNSVSHLCSFGVTTTEKADIIISINTFEHFTDPGAILREMDRMLKPKGYVLLAFGPTWFHPLGGHLFSVFPWAHLIFSEKALIRWRSDFKSDGATRFSEVEGGLNQMTIGKFERIIERSPFCFENFETVPIATIRMFHNRVTREFLTSYIRCKLLRKAPMDM